MMKPARFDCKFAAGKFAAGMLLAILVAAVQLPSISSAQQTFPYTNNFTSAELSIVNQPDSATWTLDTDEGMLNFREESPEVGAGVASSAGEQITGVVGSNFVVSTRFTLNEMEGTNLGITTGFGAFSMSDAFTSSEGLYYLADWRLGGGGNASQIGSLRILAFEPGGNFSTIASGGNAGMAVVGETYELRLTGTIIDGGDLNMSFAVFDDAGESLGEVSGIEFANFLINGEFFGLRNRTAGADHILDIDYHHFSVTLPGTGQLDGDFNNDGQVDAADYTVWRDGLGGTFTSDDYNTWRNGFGSTAAAAGSAAAAPVPEPAACCLALLALLSLPSSVHGRHPVLCAKVHSK